jgi:hypothetical protein
LASVDLVAAALALLAAALLFIRHASIMATLAICAAASLLLAALH